MCEIPRAFQGPLLILRAVRHRPIPVPAHSILPHSGKAGDSGVGARSTPRLGPPSPIPQPRRASQSRRSLLHGFPLFVAIEDLFTSHKLAMAGFPTLLLLFLSLVAGGSSEEEEEEVVPFGCASWACAGPTPSCVTWRPCGAWWWRRRRRSGCWRLLLLGLAILGRLRSVTEAEKRSGVGPLLLLLAGVAGLFALSFAFLVERDERLCVVRPRPLGGAVRPVLLLPAGAGLAGAAAGAAGAEPQRVRAGGRGPWG
ncbi:hypothetical protein SKAU_G00302620 [Synaphobranchus kaupii]|uniref:Uncharacterized protein n=1 Tax=Synaphobranchus kaupii TaxID=118154 RepID=A0A9Q1EW23_SYNKA|nr:hypothetical protein SKAU_G00302620 [Synaphobranchus kaupii]